VSDRERIAAAARARLALLDAMAEQIVAAANEQAGTPVLVPRTPGILDATRADLDAMTLQAQAWLGAMRIVDRWMLPTRDARTLGAIVKTVPLEDAAELRRLLQLAGVLPADPGGVP
jgi:hypothetical protein